MSGLHLNHKVSWSELLQYLVVYDDPGVKLPVGKCGRIHAIDKRSKRLVNQRSYLVDKICSDSDCTGEITDHKIFRKSEKGKVSLKQFGHDRSWQDGKPVPRQLAQFSGSFASAIREFATTERQKFPVERNGASGDVRCFKDRCADAEAKLAAQSWWPVDENHDSCGWKGCTCLMFSSLMEVGETATILSFTNEEIAACFSCQHGGQAVGNNMRFLYHHVMTVYLWTNLIVAAGLQEKPDEWGPMKPTSTYNFRQSLMDCCDGQSFLHASRKYLSEDVYMKDFEAMRQLCKDCFRFLYLYEMIQMEIDKDYGNRCDYRTLEYEIQLYF